jgi:hypothetical protein
MPRKLLLVGIALAALVAGCAVGGGPAYKRDELRAAAADPAFITSHIDMTSPDALSIFKSDHAIKRIGILSVKLTNGVPDKLFSSSSHSGLGWTSVTESSIKFSFDPTNFCYVVGMMEDHIADTLAKSGYTVKKTEEMKKFPAYAMVGGATDGMDRTHGGDKEKGTRNRYAIVASDGNTYDWAPSLTNNDTWGDTLAQQAGVDALLIIGLHTGWYIADGETAQDGVNGTLYSVTHKAHMFFVVPHAVTQAAGGHSTGIVKQNNVYPVSQKFNYTDNLFLPRGEPTPTSLAKNHDMWVRYAEDLSYLATLMLSRVTNELPKS